MDVIVEIFQRNDAVSVLVRRPMPQTLDERSREDAGTVADVGIISEIRGTCAGQQKASFTSQGAGQATTFESTRMTAVKDDHRDTGRRLPADHLGDPSGANCCGFEPVTACVAGAKVEFVISV